MTCWNIRHHRIVATTRVSAYLSLKCAGKLRFLGDIQRERSGLEQFVERCNLGPCLGVKATAINARRSERVVLVQGQSVAVAEYWRGKRKATRLPIATGSSIKTSSWTG